MVDPQMVLDLFAGRFDGKADVLATAPGRVNLIGEHVDYNNGLVLPMAVDRGITIAGRRRDDRVVVAWSDAMDQLDRFELDATDPNRDRDRHEWSGYIRGVAALLARRGVDLPGADLAIASDLPVGGGLSSSASLEVACALALLGLAEASIEPVQLAKLCQQAEHEFAGVPCGLMDQFAVLFGQSGHAVRMDCRTLQIEQVPCDHEAIAWVVVDSRAPRRLAGSGYAKRRKECDRALALLRRGGLELDDLGQVTLSMLEEHEERLGPVLAARVRHVVTEIARVAEGADYLALGRYDLFGRLMFASHRSLAEDYQASIDELDHIVACGGDTLGVYGCRLTGGGWGGCAIALLAVEATRFFAEQLADSYGSRFGRTPVCTVVRPADGARVERI